MADFAPENAGIWNRRGFLKKSAVGALTSVFGAELVFAGAMPPGHLPLPLADPDLPGGKNPGLLTLGNRPWNIETPPHLLDDAITPADKMFVRNNGNVPQTTNAADWTLTIEGESAARRKTFSLNDLKRQFKVHTCQLVLECAGNGRSGFYPATSGNQWANGAVSCAAWTGVRLRDVLQRVGIKDDAVYIGYYGKDTHLSGDATKPPISRGVPMRKALEDETLLAWSMNGQDIPVLHGHPLRLVIGGWPASVSGKWIDRIAIRNKIHDGPKMEGNHYRVPEFAVEPGSQVPENQMRIIESMPVKSVITYPKTGAMTLEHILELRGQAWAGDLQVSAMHTSIDYGATWQPCDLQPPPNRLAWQRWTAQVRFPQKGYYEVWARATDSQGVMQPMMIPAWNPSGYLNNACHRIAVKIA